MYAHVDVYVCMHVQGRVNHSAICVMFRGQLLAFLHKKLMSDKKS